MPARGGHRRGGPARGARSRRDRIVVRHNDGLTTPLSKTVAGGELPPPVDSRKIGYAMAAAGLTLIRHTLHAAPSDEPAEQRAVLGSWGTGVLGAGDAAVALLAGDQALPPRRHDVSIDSTAWMGEAADRFAAIPEILEPAAGQGSGR